MKKLTIYETAMCCPTGLCGVSIDTELLRMSTVINNLKKKGINVERHNLTNSPMKFMSNQIVNKKINENGVDDLPFTLLEDEIVISGRYPTNVELAEYLDVSLDLLESDG